MKYISVGTVNKPSTEHIVYVSHYGYEYTLTGDLASAQSQAWSLFIFSQQMKDGIHTRISFNKPRKGDIHYGRKKRSL